MKQFISPFVVSAEAVTTATLSFTDCFGGCTSYALTVVNGTGEEAGRATLSFTGELPIGVARLRIASKCGCFSQYVYTGCSPHPVLGFGGTHEGSGGTPEIVPSGCETPAP